MVLSIGDYVLVALVTGLAKLGSGSSPEWFVASVCVTLAFGLLLSSRMCVSRRNKATRTFCNVMVLVFLAGAYLATKYLALEPVEQVKGYEVLSTNAFHPSESDLPKTPSIGSKLETDGEWFKDEHGRTLLLRGVNLSGATKVPTKPKGDTWYKDGDQFYNWANVSFVGRPFPLEEADEHFARLRVWGFNFVRFLVTWEAVEHDGPEKYDEEYLGYLQKVVRIAHRHGISMFIDPHQDVWSRWTGGDGAPGWTLEKVGFDLRTLHESGSTISHQEYGDPFPQMIWPTNVARLATATMFTLFFAGDVYAPKTYIDGVPVQQYLQSHYIGAMKKVAFYLKDEPNVFGFDTFNEPSNGFVGVKHLEGPSFPVPMGWHMSAWTGMQLGAGFPQDVHVFRSALVYDRTETLNPNGVSAWKSKDRDVWRANGVWDIDAATGKPRLLRPDHFAYNKMGKPVNFLKDFLAPFFTRYAVELRKVRPDLIIFAEPHIDPLNPRHDPAPENVEGERFAWAPHWYNAATLVGKMFRPWVGIDIDTQTPVVGSYMVQNTFIKNLRHIKETGKSLGGKSVPTLLGECGIAMDLDRDENGMAYAYKTNDFSAQILALDSTMIALEANLLSFTLWNYTPDNNNKRGDLWNDEDLSLFSTDQMDVKSPTENIHSGGRALQSAIRPYPMKTRGEPIEYSFDFRTRTFHYRFRPDYSDAISSEEIPTVIFVPNYQYPKGYQVELSDRKGKFTKQRDAQTLLYHQNREAKPREVTITITSQ